MFGPFSCLRHIIFVPVDTVCCSDSFLCLSHSWHSILNDAPALPHASDISPPSRPTLSAIVSLFLASRCSDSFVCFEDIILLALGAKYCSDSDHAPDMLPSWQSMQNVMSTLAQASRCSDSSSCSSSPSCSVLILLLLFLMLRIYHAPRG